MSGWSSSLLLIAACTADDSLTPEPPIPVAASEEPAATETPAADESQHMSISGFRFTVPPGWRRAELSDDQRGFIDARFDIPAHGDDVRLTLSTVAGGVESNIERWLGQFQLPEGTTPNREEFEVDGLPVTWIDVSGDYQGMGGPLQSGWRLLGVAFHGPQRDFYIKLTGPAAALGDLEPEFRTFVTSARRDSP